MNNQYPFSDIDSLLFQFALQTRELSQKKNEINQQIKVCRADIAEKKSFIETIHRNMEKLEEEMRVKQNTVTHNKANAKSMKATNSLLLQYEQTLKAELESTEASYNHDMTVYEERIASYREIYQSHEEYYYQNPLAQKLLRLQAETEEIESRIKAYDDKMTMKQTELDHFTGPAVNSSSMEKPDSVSGQQPIKEPEKLLYSQTEVDSDYAIDISSLHLNLTKEQIAQNGHTVSVEANAGEEEHMVEDTAACSPYPEKASSELSLYELLDEQSWADEVHKDEQERETEAQDQAMEQQSAVSEVEEVVEDKVEERGGADEDQTPREEDNEGLPAFPQSSPQETNPQSCLAKMSVIPSTPTFQFNFSPTSSPHQGSSDTTSPAFLFSMTPDHSTPGFSGFGFDVSTSQDEATPFAFTGSFFNEKKTEESKSSSCPEFLFGQSEQSEDFQFDFTSKTPQTTNKDFPFSFNF
ncbi:protein SIX6OS1 isoform X2 [Lates calcarifer]|uniref:Protein SIX6OS1 isoform X2 n=1 Tax=Lates calcarifer TaxID=8187 RepID=A0AAJ7LMQ7_LATCA|nr:protein SIX6OS1 isoform X2 [Lates calcarifer]